jgi:4-alpha-glucanotransferase
VPGRDRQLSLTERHAADAAGITWSYTDGMGRDRRAPAASVRAALEVLHPPPRRRERWIDRASGQAGGGLLGLFTPVYALRGADDRFGIGDLGELKALGRWARAQGVDILGTLPLLATFLERPFDPSPYTPVSRLFWNELFIDADATPERGEAGGRSPERERAGLGSAGLVDYRRAYAGKRRVLMRMADVARRSASRRAEIKRRADERPLLHEYAAFRAREGSPAWYHIYTQHVMEDQLSALARESQRGRVPGLYLDLPIGVHRRGFDAHRFQDQFVPGFTVGAPPDGLFTGGQDWGFDPLHPVRTSADGHSYFRACIREHLRFARMLRIDHVAGLHRQFWVPRGGDPSEGVYVRYPARELYGVLAEEAARAGATIVGEDLGTVEPEVRTAMKRHGVLRMHVAQFEMSPQRPLTRPPAACVASFGTHDTPTFAGYMHARDVETRVRLGYTPRSAARGEKKYRATLRDSLARATGTTDDFGMLSGVLTSLARSRAAVVLGSLEDLWLEPDPQNIPGTTTQHPNWRRRAARTLAEITGDPAFASVLRELAAVRKGSR